MLTRKNSKPIFYGLMLAATFGFGVAKASALENPWVQASMADGTYCHLKFPAIRQSTLYTDNPQLKNSSTGDMVDYYGPCDHDPLGKDEIQSQRDELNMQWQVNYGGSD
jgi:hypothetical protein